MVFVEELTDLIVAPAARTELVICSPATSPAVLATVTDALPLATVPVKVDP
jgi:hypothetical protein